MVLTTEGAIVIGIVTAASGERMRRLEDDLVLPPLLCLEGTKIDLCGILYEETTAPLPGSSCAGRAMSK